MLWLVLGAVISAVQTFSQMQAQSRRLEYEAAVERNNAIAKQQQADITRKKAEAAARAADEDKKKAKREYMEAAGTNRSLLAAANVDITEGSALDLLEGNYNRFADDMGEMEYQKELDRWATEREADIQDWEAEVSFSNSNYLESTAGSLGDSLLGGALAGAGTFASGYSQLSK